MKKILILSNTTPSVENLSGGIYINKRLSEYKKIGVDFDVFGFFYDETPLLKFLKKVMGKVIYDNFREKIIVEGIEWNFIKYYRNIFDVFFKSYNLKKAFGLLDKNIDIKKYDLIISHGAYREGYLAKMFKNKYNIPYYLILHGTDIHTDPFKNNNVKKFTLEALENSQKCIFVSDFLRKKAKEFGYSDKNSETIPNGFDPSIFFFEDKSKKKKKLGFEKSKLVGFVGNLIDVKNVFVLPDIFEKVKKEYKDVEFVVIGDGNLKSELKKKFEERSVIVRFTGRIEQKEVAEYMRAMDFMVLPSKNEGWPCVVLEAQACGTYVVGSDRGGRPEAIGEVGKAFKLDKSFSENISNEILDKIEKGYDMEKLINRSKKFSWKDLAKKELNIIIRGKK
jgi:glycosyltransferase involved in cell wall biosynthesis